MAHDPPGFVQINHSRIPIGYGVARKPHVVQGSPKPVAFVYRVIHWASLVSCDTMVSTLELNTFPLGLKAVERHLIDRAVAKLKTHPAYSPEVP